MKLGDIEVPLKIEKTLSMSKGQKFIYSLINYDGKQPFFMADLERYGGWNKPQPDIRKIINSLIDMGILISFEKIEKDYNFKLNKRLLKKLIRNCDNFILNGKFIESTTLIQQY